MILEKRICKEQMMAITNQNQTQGRKPKKKLYFLFFFCLCVFVFASYISCFYTVTIWTESIAQTSLRKTINDLEERSMHLNKMCMNLKIKSPNKTFYNLYVHKPKGLLYCKVPKCGSTYWTRFFQILHNINVKKDPFDENRFKIHSTQMEMSSLDKNDHIHWNETIRFLVTRSPYSRLYSAYVDKIFLPEFWNTYGRDIINNFRHNATKLSKLCGNDVTFEEFLKMITHRIHRKMNGRNSHWLPIEQLCSPCKYKYNFIIKLETFSRDRDYLVSKVGIKEQLILNYNNISHWDYSLLAIKDMCLTIFTDFRGQKPEKCYQMEALLRKIFISFQIQGYIREDAHFDRNRFGDLKSMNINKIIEVFQNIYKEYPILNRYEWKKQRQAFMKNAYKFVDREILKEIKKCYNSDFQIFNYDPEPEEIFGKGREQKKAISN